MNYERDLSFHPRTVEEWEEYVVERAAICEYLGDMSRAGADRAALIMAGPRPGDREQLTLTGKPAQQPREAARSKRR